MNQNLKGKRGAPCAGGGGLEQREGIGMERLNAKKQWNIEEKVSKKIPGNTGRGCISEGLL